MHFITHLSPKADEAAYVKTKNDLGWIKMEDTSADFFGCSLKVIIIIYISGAYRLQVFTVLQ